MRWDPTGEEVCPAEERAMPGGETRIVKKECGDLWLGVSRDSPCGLGPARGSAMGTVGGGRRGPLGNSLFVVWRLPAGGVAREGPSTEQICSHCHLWDPVNERQGQGDLGKPQMRQGPSGWKCAAVCKEGAQGSNTE